MTERVREILSWYASDNPGTLTNLARLLNHGPARRHGPAGHPARRPGLRARPGALVRAEPRRLRSALPLRARASTPGCNAYAAPLGFIEAGAAEFAGEIPLILKLNNSDSLYGGSDPCPALTGSVDEALRLGCVGDRLHDLPRLVGAQRDVSARSGSSPRRRSARASPSSCGRTRAAPASRRRARRRSTSSPTRRRSPASSARTSSR